MSWDAKDVALLKELWAAGHSAGQIASRLGHSRNAVSAKLKRLGHKRGHKPPTANPQDRGRANAQAGAGGSLCPAGGAGGIEAEAEVKAGRDADPGIHQG